MQHAQQQQSESPSTLRCSFLCPIIISHLRHPRSPKSREAVTSVVPLYVAVMSPLIFHSATTSLVSIHQMTSVMKYSLLAWHIVLGLILIYIGSIVCYRLLELTLKKIRPRAEVSSIHETIQRATESATKPFLPVSMVITQYHDNT